MADMSSRYDRIGGVLQSSFSPVQLEIEDESAKHAGHAAQKGVTGGQTHYRVVMVSEAFAGMSRLARSRAVHAALDAEFKTGLHALSLVLKAPAEASLAVPF
jgi:stress-induced morphogen